MFAGYRSRNARSPVGDVESPTRFMRATPSGQVVQSAKALARKSGPAAAGADCAFRASGLAAIMIEPNKRPFMGRSLLVESSDAIPNVGWPKGIGKKRPNRALPRRGELRHVSFGAPCTMHGLRSERRPIVNWRPAFGVALLAIAGPSYAQHPPGHQGSRNLTVVAHIPL